MCWKFTKMDQSGSLNKQFNQFFSYTIFVRNEVVNSPYEWHDFILLVSPLLSPYQDPTGWEEIYKPSARFASEINILEELFILPSKNSQRSKGL